MKKPSLTTLACLATAMAFPAHANMPPPQQFTASGTSANCHRQQALNQNYYRKLEEHIVDTLSSGADTELAARIVGMLRITPQPADWPMLIEMTGNDDYASRVRNGILRMQDYELQFCGTLATIEPVPIAHN